ncbi:MAG: fatty acid desaturase [Candidatus Puniceispirillales bacterium]
MRRRSKTLIDSPTAGLVLVCYGAFGVATTVVAETMPVVAIVLLCLAVTLHSSLQHEVLHGHLSRNRLLAVAAVFPAMGLFIPYERFRDTHLAHHHDETLTDPYDDPESHFVDPAVWRSMPGWKQAVLRFNNTLAGRMLVGPAISLLGFWRKDLLAMRRGDRAVMRAYALHFAGVMMIITWLAALSPMPFLFYLIGCYIGLSLLKIRTYLEHRAHEESGKRSVIIEDRGPLALLFLNNNLHALHHDQPDLRWYDLPAAYATRREDILRRNDHYLYRNYGQIFRRYLFRAKDQVPHPLRHAGPARTGQ